MTETEIWVYLVFFGTLVAAGFGFGPPEEIALPLAGVTAIAKADVRWWILLPVCICGVIIADLILYSVGRHFGARLLGHRWMARLVSPAKLRDTEKHFHEYGVSILLVGRLVPGIRAPLFLTAGAIRLPVGRFLVADALGAVLGNTLLFFLGFWLGDWFMDLLTRVEKLKPVLIVTALGGVVAFVWFKFLRHPVSTGNPADVPLIGHQIAEHLKTEEGPPKECAPNPPEENGKVEEHPHTATPSESRPGR
jgi:membrane protein DedA with SNARE-associated domain